VPVSEVIEDDEGTFINYFGQGWMWGETVETYYTHSHWLMLL
jgi:hypothetical protein